MLELEKSRGLLARLRDGRPILGAQLTLSDSAVVEIFGRAGFDLLVVDAEHAPHNAATLKSMLQAGMHTDAVVLARPMRLDPEEIRRYLDLGSPGVLCPFIETRAQAELLVGACRYPPVGIRGYGPRRAGGYGFDDADYFHLANDSMICLPIIESETAVSNITEIVSVEGIAGALIGPMDLSINLGIAGQLEHERYLEAVAAVRSACINHEKAMGHGCYSIQHATACKATGDTLLLVGGDDQALREGAAATVAALR